MSTAQDIIDAALQLLGVADPGETPATTERNIGLLEINKLIDEWSAAGITIPWLSNDSASLTGAASYTIGTSQTINTTKPLLLKSASCAYSGHEEPCEIVTIDEFVKIGDKARTGKLAFKVAFVPTSATAGTLYVWPLANGSTLNLWSYKPLSTLGSLSTALALPPGYESALQQALAVYMAPRYGRDVSLLKMNAEAALAKIQGLNAAVLGSLPSLMPAPPPAAG